MASLRRGMFGKALAAPLALLLIGACAPSMPALDDREALRNRVDAHPGVPLVLPVVLPEDYTFFGVPEMDKVTMDGPTIMRTSYYLKKWEGGGSPLVVGLCVTDEATTEVCGEDRDTASVGRTVDRYKVLVRFVDTLSPSVEDADFWRTVPLTADIDAVPWLS